MTLYLAARAKHSTAFYTTVYTLLSTALYSVFTPQVTRRHTKGDAECHSCAEHS